MNTSADALGMIDLPLGDNPPDAGGGAPAGGQVGGQTGGQVGGQTGGQVGGQQQNTQPETIDAPVNWGIEAREMFAKQTPEAQKWLMDRHKAMEGDYTQKLQVLAQQRQAVQGIQSFAEHVGRYSQQLNGVDPRFIVDRAFNIHNTLTNGTPEQKIAALKQLVEEYGIAPPGEGGQQAAPAAPAPDPRIDQMMGYLAYQHQQQQNAGQQAQAARRQYYAREITSFMAEKNEQGELAHPYFADVEDTIAQLAAAEVAAGKTPKLSELYEAACYMTPSVRERLLAEGQSQVRADQVNRATRASEASSTLGGGSQQSTAQPKGLSAIIDAALDGRIAA